MLPRLGLDHRLQGYLKVKHPKVKISEKVDTKLNEIRVLSIPLSPILNLSRNIPSYIG